jgi:hypothetical protein
MYKNTACAELGCTISEALRPRFWSIATPHGISPCLNALDVDKVVD